jgi:hypothetical protein
LKISQSHPGALRYCRAKLLLWMPPSWPVLGDPALTESSPYLVVQSYELGEGRLMYDLVSCSHAGALFKTQP